MDKLKCERCGLNRQIKFYKSARSRICQPCQRKKGKRTERNRRILRLYGITQDEYEVLLAAQGGVCAICRGTRNYNLHIDHDHAKERAGFPMRECLRGLLCASDNKRLLPAARDEIQRLLSAVEYLRNPPAQAVLGGHEDVQEVPRGETAGSISARLEAA